MNKVFLLFVFLSSLSVAPLIASATPAPKSGETTGAAEYSLNVPVSKSANGMLYSESLHFGLATERFLPMNFSFDVGFLNPTKQRYTQLSFFGFGKQPIPKERTDFFARIDLFSLLWGEGIGARYSPGIETGISVPISKTLALILSAKASLGDPTLFLIGLGLIHAKVHAPKDNNEGKEGEFRQVD